MSCADFTNWPLSCTVRLERTLSTTERHCATWAVATPLLTRPRRHNSPFISVSIFNIYPPQTKCLLCIALEGKFSMYAYIRFSRPLLILVVAVYDNLETLKNAKVVLAGRFTLIIKGQVVFR